MVSCGHDKSKLRSQFLCSRSFNASAIEKTIAIRLPLHPLTNTSFAEIMSSPVTESMPNTKRFSFSFGVPQALRSAASSRNSSVSSQGSVASMTSVDSSSQSKDALSSSTPRMQPRPAAYVPKYAAQGHLDSTKARKQSISRQTRLSISS